MILLNAGSAWSTWDAQILLMWCALASAKAPWSTCIRGAWRSGCSSLDALLAKCAFTSTSYAHIQKLVLRSSRDWPISQQSSDCTPERLSMAYGCSWFCCFSLNSDLFCQIVKLQILHWELHNFLTLVMLLPMCRKISSLLPTRRLKNSRFSCPSSSIPWSLSQCFTSWCDSLTLWVSRWLRTTEGAGDSERTRDLWIMCKEQKIEVVCTI